MTNNQDQFVKVEFEKERIAILNDVTVQVSELVGIREPSGEVVFQPVKVDGKDLVATVLKKSGDLQKGDGFKLAFSLETGQYIISATLSRFLGADAVLSPNESEFYRLQRRNNFRVRLQVKNGIKFHLKSANGQQVKPEIISVVDLSAGGAKLTVPAANAQTWKQRTLIEGELDALEDRRFTLKARIVNVGIQGGAATVGLEFQDVSGRDQQALLTTCLALRRTFGSIFDR